MLAFEFLYEQIADYTLEEFSQKNYSISIKMILDKKSEKRKNPNEVESNDLNHLDGNNNNVSQNQK